MTRLLLLPLFACTGEEPQSKAPPSDDTASEPTNEYVFVPYEPAPLGDALHDRLCAPVEDPSTHDAQVFIDCAMEGANLAPTPPITDELVVVAYNLERGFRLDDQIDLFASGALPTPDVLLISEADRGCARTDGRNVPHEFALALGLNYAYAVEFVEVARPEPMGMEDDDCEHGNFVASRFPMGNVGSFRHAANKSWYDAGEKRLGGRIAVHADIQVGDAHVSVMAVHFASSPGDVEIQIEQGVESAEFMSTRGIPAIPGGDTNAPFYWLDLLNGTAYDLTIQAFEDLGFVDAHLPIPPEERGTVDAGFILDLILTRDVEVLEAEVCGSDACTGLSDHLPVWARVRI
jgi:endonuclease/exonuclease/phosphatase family metal-dependent hydrolase